MEKYIILGHENPDVDSMVSGYLLETLMKRLGYDARFIIPDDVIDQMSVDICLKYGFNPYDYQGSLVGMDDCKFILVDHHVRDVDGEIVGIIDHHPTLEDICVPYYYNGSASSVACLICTDEMEKYFTKDEIILAIIACMVDTASFHSTKTRKEDIIWVKRMCEKYDIDYDQIYQTGLCLTDLSDLRSVCFNGLKKYHFDGYNVESSYIQIADYSQCQEDIDAMCEVLRQYVVDCQLEVFLFTVYDMSRFQTFVYHIRGDGYDVCVYEQYVSRANDIIPQIEKELVNKMKCRVFIGSSSRNEIDEVYLNEALEVSQTLTQDHCELVFGASSMGMMGACYQGFTMHHQPVYSCTVERYQDDLKYLNSATECVLGNTFLRTEQLYEWADVIVLLPGGTGTMAEFFEVLEENRTTQHPKKVILYNFYGFYDKMLDFIQYCIDYKFNDATIFDYFVVARTRDELISFVRESVCENKVKKL